LTSGAIQWDAPIPSKDGKKIFSLGNTLHGELVHYDTQSHQFQPFLGGISAEFVAFSQDGKSLVYVSFPDGILWKASRDGSNAQRLTDYALYATFPRWSPDGSKILLNRGSKAYLIPSSGFGSPEPILPDDKENQNEPNWSPDGSRIVFSTGGQGEIKSDIRILSLASQKVSILPGSVGMFSPRWSPDGRLIAALDVSSLDLKVFEFETKKWSLLRKGLTMFPAFSHDGRFIYSIGYESNRECVLRIRTSGGDAVPVVNLEFSFTGFYGSWMGLDPEDAPMILRDTGSNDIYALTLETK
jgi:Tol biopolymer transport system component